MAGVPTDDLFDGVAYEYSSEITARSLVLTAGACPLDATGTVIAPGDHAAQAARALRNLLTVLARHDLSAAHLVRTTIYVVGERNDLVTAWEVIKDGLAPHRPPSTLLGVAVLGYPNQLVEIDGIAARPDDTGR
jgi:enamine deaminase RidA (YjgF/YER057c/UK114 family)